MKKPEVENIVALSLQPPYLQGSLPVLQGDGGCGRGQEDGLVNYNLKNGMMFCFQDFSYFKKLRYSKTH
jgi:hypothetical protein